MTGTGTLHVKACADAVRHLKAGTSVDLHGLPGSGRTTLADAVAAELEDDGWKVLRVSGVHPLRERPLEALAAAGLVAARPAGQQGPVTALAAAVQGVAAAVRGSSTVLVVDDADDLDEVSEGAIVAARRQAPFVVLSTSRPAPRAARPGLMTLIQPGLTVPVGPLGFVDLQTLLVEVLGGAIDAGAVARVFAGSGGLAGMAVALATSARDHGALHQVDGVWRAGSDLWSPEAARALGPLLHRLSPPALEGLRSLALAGTVDIATARQVVAWDVLEELDEFRLLRFVLRGEQMLVGLYPEAIVEHFRRLVGATHLRLDEQVATAFGGAEAWRPEQTAPWQLLFGEEVAAAGAEVPADQDEDVVLNRLLLEHWQRELLVRRSEWERSPSPQTASELLRTMLVTGADAPSVIAVRKATPTTGDRRQRVAFDDWYALFLGTVVHDLEGARSVLDQARTEAGEWVEIIDAIEAFVEFLGSRAPDPDELPVPAPDAPTDTREIVSAVRVDLLLARGRTAEALAELDRIGEPTTEFARSRRASRAWALHLDGRFDEAESLARDLLAAARREHDIANIVGAAYVLMNVMVTRGDRQAELRTLLGSVLSTGLLPALDRPQHVALLSVAAGMVLGEGRVTTARTLVRQALALKTGPGPYPLGSPTSAIAGLDSLGLGAEEAHGLAADRLWAESETLIERGYLVSGYVCGLLAVAENVIPERCAALLDVGAQIPAALFREYDALLRALIQDDLEVIVSTVQHLADLGMVWTAAAGIRAAMSALRAAGKASRAIEVLEDVRRRLTAWGPDADAGLRSIMETTELTAREREVARLAASGQNNQDIARRLLISVRTVENHLNRAFRKLGVASRAELSRMLGD